VADPWPLLLLLLLLLLRNLVAGKSCQEVALLLHQPAIRSDMLLPLLVLLVDLRVVAAAAAAAGLVAAVVWLRPLRRATPTAAPPQAEQMMPGVVAGVPLQAQCWSHCMVAAKDQQRDLLLLLLLVME
jgi:hypothetical protein